MCYESIIIGGGIAGLQAAIQLGRYQHRVLLIDNENGRSTICRSYHNILGWPDGISGEQLRLLGKQHAKSLGISFLKDTVIQLSRDDSQGFLVNTLENGQFAASTLLLATGIMDRLPPLPHLMPCLGLTVYVCPDCDGYEVAGRRTIVMGSGPTGANMALTLSYWTSDLIYINHEQKPLSMEHMELLAEHHIELVNEGIDSILCEEEGVFSGVKLTDGRTIDGERGFVAFGGNEVRSSLAEQIGVERLENKHIIVDPRTKMTNVPNVWAAGDIGVHSEQVTIALGEGSQAAIWIHKALMQKQEGKNK
ncbi:NAD(P)/FAD-dependent oxidoreductase [Paenibacillus alvei]|uniref:NAD(P)/FAD-dependent oxidoreductase n=1 Tax=Paenibacillus alvei TaxID=44250 RepID=A0AAP7A0U6_PAEAL|nr:NAD(P)/FAD-dependent oxidoreductase [Paenibacillus alvei]MBG9733629.1 pyridine nucleotide-disulfide oxidoreductase [Paenibacillus alvei]MBG9744037.1 pyridine nucleotide-disulfide oxidoreductase [Paenibacillus alvei]MCY9582940.1 NAD(P)/FAD-dependent oxidoreductase [Paenibacillus alvei]MCY9588203.1 NAD(P)/FAD-dependent oxidoreductase [Paenibacillus alvei]NEZ42485.1 NAD(P)-binding protein [Paenibacillus alvei]